jgi:hypothetical protein
MNEFELEVLAELRDLTENYRGSDVRGDRCGARQNRQALMPAS